MSENEFNFIFSWFGLGLFYCEGSVFIRKWNNWFD